MNMQIDKKKFNMKMRNYNCENNWKKSDTVLKEVQTENRELCFHDVCFEACAHYQQVTA